MAELEKLNANARQALMMADDAQKAGDAAKAAEYNAAAETFANQLIQVEKDVESLKTMVLRVHPGLRSGQGRRAAEQPVLQQKLAESQKLLSQLDQAKMQEQMNKAMARCTRPSARTCRRSTRCEDKIEARYAKAKGIVRAHRDVGRVADARGRAGHRQRRGPGPPRRAARRARLDAPPPRRDHAVEQPAAAARLTRAGPSSATAQPAAVHAPRRLPATPQRSVRAGQSGRPWTPDRACQRQRSRCPC